MSIIIFILVLGLLIFIHELGHFLVAKKSGIRVDEFAIGFAEWIINWPEDWHRIEELLEIYKKEKQL